MTIELFEHNNDAYNKLYESLSTGNKAAIVHPTGTGKSYIGFKLAEQNPNKRFLWLVPNMNICSVQVNNLINAYPDIDLGNVWFLTYGRLMRLTDKELRNVIFDYIIFDEFHRCGAPCWGIGVKRLLIKQPNAKIIGLSATNIRYLDGRRDMAEELFDSNIVSHISLGEAMATGILCAPQYVIAVYSYDEELKRYHKWIDNVSKESTKKKAVRYINKLKRNIDAAEGMHLVFNKYICNRTGKYLAFCSNRKHMEKIVDCIGAWLSDVDKKPHIYMVESRQSEKDLKEQLDLFISDESNHIKILFSIDMLNEGIHIDSVDGVMLFRPTTSPTVYKQQIGRALSSLSNKEAIIFDFVNNFENINSISPIRDEMKAAVAKYELYGQKSRIVSYDFAIFDETRDCRELFGELDRILSSSWEDYYSEAKQYYERNGNLLISSDYKTHDGLALGQWIKEQRKLKTVRKEATYAKERIARLDEIGMIWNVNDRKWEMHYMAAYEYYMQNGHLNVPSDYISQNGILLGCWISNCRQIRKHHSCGVLTDERIVKLDEIGMIWDRTSEDIWKENYAHVLAYKKAHGNIDVPSEYVTKEGIALGHWITAQRVKNNRNLLSAYQKEALNSIGMRWKSSDDAKWEAMFFLAEEYREDHGDINVPFSYKTESGKNLGRWISKQRAKKRNGMITRDQKDLLDNLGMRWEPLNRWYESYEKALEYYKEHKNVEVNSRYKMDDGFCLGAWIYRQRKRLMSNELSDKKSEMLSAIGIAVDKP